MLWQIFILVSYSKRQERRQDIPKKTFTNVKQINDKKIAVVAPENDYLLRFGEETYKIDIDNVDVFLKFIKEKVNAI